MHICISTCLFNFLYGMQEVQKDINALLDNEANSDGKCMLFDILYIYIYALYIYIFYTAVIGTCNICSYVA